MLLHLVHSFTCLHKNASVPELSTVNARNLNRDVETHFPFPYNSITELNCVQGDEVVETDLNSNYEHDSFSNNVIIPNSNPENTSFSNRVN